MLKQSNIYYNIQNNKLMLISFYKIILQFKVLGKFRILIYCKIIIFVICVTIIDFFIKYFKLMH